MSEALVDLDYARPAPSRPKRPLALVGIALASVLSGTLVGASTNAVNGAVSPTYFVNIMRWEFVPNIWVASVVQGVLEGSVVGLIFATVLTTTVGIITRGTCTAAIGLRWLRKLVLAIYVSWFVGGVCGVGLAAAFPSFFEDTFFGVPHETVQRLRFAWVGGSIWGAEFGGLGVVIVGLILFRISWRRMLTLESGGTMPRIDPCRQFFCR